MPGHPDITQVESCLTRWLPDETFVRAARIGDCPSLPEEQELIANAVEKRRHEFATGRWLAREGLRHFGLADQPLLMGRLRNPLWPDGVLGTLSHDGDLCAVALLRKSAMVLGIGIDLISLAERAGRIGDLAPMFVTSPGETDSIATLNVPADPAMLLFSLKEAAIKALSFHLTDFIDMRAIELRRAGDCFELRMADGTIRAELFAAVTDRYLVTAATIR
jgi:enterobactin synthetase component D